ncbi:MAG: secretin N-terminal domain-containing protein [Methylophilus sp.]|nr:secretin N-terminal domain-containing protein [Methylophilus sp.]
MTILNSMRQHQRWLGLLTVWALLLQLTGCAFAPWEKSPQKDAPPEARVSTSTKQLEKNPEDARLRKDAFVTKESAIVELLTQAEQARLNGNIEGASKLYDRVLSIAPDNQSAITGKQSLEVEKDLAKRLEKASEYTASNQLQLAKSIVHDVLLENPQQKNAAALNSQIDEKLGTANKRPPQLKPPFDKPVTLELRDANIKVVFEALSRATGINFILDKDIRPDTKATIFIKKLPIEEAIDMVLSSNGLQKKALSENSALVFPSNPQKLKDYQDLMIRSFYLNNTSAKQIAALLKAMLKTKDVFIDERLNMIVMRDTPEVVRIAEKLVQANDIPDAEVMLDIEVLEVSRNRLQELGIVYPNQLAVLSSGTSTTLTLDALKHINEGVIGVSPNPAVNFKKTTGDVNLLSNPRIRVKNNEKAKILVGDKVPIITTTSTANVGISESVTYVDVGLKLDVEPHVTLDDFVNIKVGLEVSSLGDKTVTTNGATVYTIGTRNANTVLRLKDGETQILAGLILDDERKNAKKLPGLGDIPLIGRLFSSQEDKKSKTEIVLAITPRIISNIQLPKAEISEYWSGTENVISDKPQISTPATGFNPRQSAMDRLREQRNQRAQQVDTSNQPEALPVTPIPAPEPQQPDPVPEQPQPVPEPQAAQPPSQTQPNGVGFDTANPPPHM